MGLHSGILSNSKVNKSQFSKMSETRDISRYKGSELESDDYTSSSRSSEHCLLMSHAGDAQLIYKMAGTLIRTGMSAQSSHQNMDSYISNATDQVKKDDEDSEGQSLDRSGFSSARFGSNDLYQSNNTNT